MDAGMKRLPESELEIMMIIWRHDGPVNRMEIEEIGRAHV